MSLMTMIVKMSEGLGKTCAIFFLTLLFSLPLGMIVALLRMSKPLRGDGRAQQAHPRRDRLLHQLCRLLRGDLPRRH